MYCEKCKRIFDGASRCPACGSKKLRSPTPTDLCYLTETDPMFGSLLKDVLEQNEIPVLTSSAMGAGMALRVGPMFDQIRFYVPCEYLLPARALVEEIFQAPTVPQPDPDQQPEE